MIGQAAHYHSGSKQMSEGPRTATDMLLKQHAATYDALARDYHRSRFAPPPGRYDLRETAALIRDLAGALHLRDRSSWRALDVACGTGKVAITLAQLGAQVTALDAAPAMLEQCAARAREAGVEGSLTPVRASAEQLPFDDNSFDAVCSFRFLHLFPTSTYPEFLREMVRVAKPGGYVVVEANNRWYGGALYRLRSAAYEMGGCKATSAVSVGSLAALDRRLSGVQTHAVLGLLLPKGWWLGEGSRLSRAGRMLARGPLKGVSKHLIAVYRKE